MCRMEFEPEEEVVALPCKHLYHGECISQWLKDRKVSNSLTEESTRDEWIILAVCLEVAVSASVSAQRGKCVSLLSLELCNKVNHGTLDTLHA